MIIVVNLNKNDKANPTNKQCSGWREIDYDEEMRKKEGLVHPLRTNLYRGYAPNEFSNEPGMPHIMTINKQHGANKRESHIFKCFLYRIHMKNGLVE